MSQFDGAYPLSDKLAEQIYDLIREWDIDIFDIGATTGFQQKNIKKLKDHVFSNKDNLDPYGLDQINQREYKCFDGSFSQPLS